MPARLLLDARALAPVIVARPVIAAPDPDDRTSREEAARQEDEEALHSDCPTSDKGSWRGKQVRVLVDSGQQRAVVERDEESFELLFLAFRHAFRPNEKTPPGKGETTQCAATVRLQDAGAGEEQALEGWGVMLRMVSVYTI